MIELRDIRITKDEHKLQIDHWKLQPGEQWALFGHHDTGKALLLSLLCQRLAPDQGTITGVPSPTCSVSLEQQQALVEKELESLRSDGDEINEGRTVLQLLIDTCSECDHQAYLNMVDLQHLSDRPFLHLSTGETRRLMLAMALVQDPHLLVLDDPYAGLDVEHQQQLRDLLAQIADHCQLVLICSRMNELPISVTHVGLLEGHGFNQQMPVEQWKEHPVHQRLNALAQQQAIAIAQQIGHNRKPYQDIIFRISNGFVGYQSGVVFTGLNWTVEPGQHWQIKGPNGCGKSSLLGLISGDHPQCYSNSIEIFGKPRGQGESIWSIKQQLGIVSSALHLQYRVNCTAIDVVLSGLFDSIGIYQKTSTEQRMLARQWLSLFGMNKLEKQTMRQFSYGEQRVLLIARALIKAPRLLLLDEPCQGLDFLNRQVVLQALELIARHNLSQLIYVTHHLDEQLDSIKNVLLFNETNFEFHQSEAGVTNAADSARLRPLPLAR